MGRDGGNGGSAPGSGRGAPDEDANGRERAHGGDAQGDNPPATVDNVTAVVLAAGTAARLGGCDKSLIGWRGRPFISHIVQRMAMQSARVAVNTPATSLPLPESVARLPDPWPDQRGPLAGILAGLEWSATPWVLFVPCDNPQPSIQLRQRLADSVRTPDAPAPAIVYARCGENQHYLYALIATRLATSLRQFIEAGGRSVYRWYAAEQALGVPFVDPADFFNVNTPADLQELHSRE